MIIFNGGIIMKKVSLLSFLFVIVANILSPIEAFAQKETFDLATYTSLKGWKNIAFSKE